MLVVITRFLDFYSFVVIGYVLLSWVGLSPENPLQRFVGAIVEPVLKPIRKIMPGGGGLDFSPVILMIALQLLRSALYRI